MRGRRGQHTTEFVILMAIAVGAAIGVQWIVQGRLQGGLRGLTNQILGAPPAANDPEELEKLKGRELDVTAAAATDVQGEKITQIHRISVSGVRGHSRNVDVRLRDVSGSGVTDVGTIPKVPELPPGLGPKAIEGVGERR